MAAKCQDWLLFPPGKSGGRRVPHIPTQYDEPGYISPDVLEAKEKA